MAAEPPFEFGVNYAVAGADVDADMETFRKAKRPGKRWIINIVLNNGKVPIPWAIGVSDNNGNFWHGLEVALKFARDPDFYVVYNIYYGPTTADQWALARTAMLSAAAYIQQFNLPIEICIGNELTGTYGILYGITSLTQTAGVATLVAASAFPTHVGDTITIYGSTRAQYNTTFTVTNVISAGRFQFNVDPATVNPGNGNLFSLSVAQMNALIRTLATDMKAVYTAGKVSIADFNGLVNGLYSYDDWAANGIGDLDYLAAHIYPEFAGKPKYVLPVLSSAFSNAFGPLLSTLGTNKVVVGEMNLSAGTLSGISTEAHITGFRTFYKDLVNLGLKRVVEWSWNTNLSLRTSGKYNPQWGVIISNNGRIPICFLYLSRPSASSRTTTASRTTAVGRPTI